MALRGSAVLVQAFVLVDAKNSWLKKLAQTTHLILLLCQPLSKLHKCRYVRDDTIQLYHLFVHIRIQLYIDAYVTTARV